jgi:MarR family transcriptional regulator, organic hydroperoxide resistance regulator
MPDSKPIPSLARELTLNLYRTDQALTAALETVLRPTDLRLDEFNVLRILRGGGPDGYVRADIEQRMLHDPDRLLALLHRLKSRGLIEGSLRLTITNTGKDLLRTIDPAFEGEIEKRVGHIPADKLRVAVEVLQAIRTAAGA